MTVWECDLVAVETESGLQIESVVHSASEHGADTDSPNGVPAPAVGIGPEVRRETVEFIIAMLIGMTLACSLAVGVRALHFVFVDVRTAR